MMQIWSIWLMKQVNTILPDEEPSPGISDGIRLGTVVGNEVGVERSKPGAVTATEIVGEPANPIGVAVEGGIGGFCKR